MFLFNEGYCVIVFDYCGVGYFLKLRGLEGYIKVLIVVDMVNFLEFLGVCEKGKEKVYVIG